MSEQLAALAEEVARAFPQIEFRQPVELEIHLGEIRRHLTYAEAGGAIRRDALVNAAAAIYGALIQLDAQERSE